MLEATDPSTLYVTSYIRSADSYSSGESEQILGRSLKMIGAKRSDVIIATKVSSEVGTGPNDRGSSRGHIMRPRGSPGSSRAA